MSVAPKTEARLLVAYQSMTGNLQSMAEAVAEGSRDAGATVDLRPIDTVDPRDMLDYDGFIFGSPTYYGQPAAAFRQLIQDSVVVHGRLVGRLGAAFAHSSCAGGGNETTCLTLCHMFMVHGMLVMGAAQGAHYGPVSVGTPTERDFAQCRDHGARAARYALLLAAQRTMD